METTYNAQPIDKDSKPEFKTSEFDVQDSSNLILCIINAPKGKVKIDAAMTLTLDDKSVNIPLAFLKLDGEPKRILEDLLHGAGQILSSGLKKNPQTKNKIIVPEEKKIITRG